MAKKIGEGTIVFEKDIRIRSAYSVVADKEGRGPLHDYFDHIESDMMFGQKSWEKAESVLQKTAAEGAIRNAGLKKPIDFMFSGDLLNQCIGASYGLRDLFIPFLGLYGACSTMAEGLGISAMFIETGVHTLALAGAIALGIVLVTSLVRMWKLCGCSHESSLDCNLPVLLVWSGQKPLIAG